MDTNLLQVITLEKLLGLISQDLREQIEALKKELSLSRTYEELLTRDQTCKLLHINSSTLWAWTKKGRIKAYGIANRRYYKKSELLDCLIELKIDKL